MKCVEENRKDEKRRGCSIYASGSKRTEKPYQLVAHKKIRKYNRGKHIRGQGRAKIAKESDQREKNLGGTEKGEGQMV